MPRELGYDPAKAGDLRFRKRVSRLFFVLLLLVFVLISRLFYLQVIQHTFYLDEEERNRSNLLAIEPRRGVLYDRNGVILANDMPVYSLVIQRDKVKNMKQTLSELQTLLNIEPKDIQIFLKDLKNHPRFAPIPLINRLTEEETAKFLVNQYRFPGVSAQVMYLRYYPLGAPLAPVTGYVSRINPKELLQVDPNNYTASTNIGKVGIEKHFEKALHGQIGYQRVAMDAYGRHTKELQNIPPVPGNNLTLTIDSNLQKVAYDAFEGNSGALVAVQPDTGQILALVSSPSYDPNLFVGGIDTKTFRSLQDDPARPLYNRPVRGLFPFGSTIKPFYALQGLETGTVTPDFTIFDPGYFRLPGVSRVYHNWTWNVKHGGAGTVNITKALEQSNDTYFYTLGVKMGPDKLADILGEFGFGQKTGVETPEEIGGHLANPAWKAKVKHQKWFGGDTVAASIGQGYTIMTPIQLAQGITAIANRGIRHQLTLLLQQQMPDGKILVNNPPPLAPVKLKPENWDVVINGLQGVIEVGTGSYHFGQRELGKPKYTAAGKTGTAQVFNYKGQRYNKASLAKKLRDHSLFEVFAPLDHPQIAVAVIEENSDNAGLIARKVVDYYLLHSQDKTESATPKSEDAANAEDTSDPSLASEDEETSDADDNDDSDSSDDNDSDDN